MSVRFRLAVTAGALLAMAFSSTAFAQSRGDRAQTWDVGVQLTHLGSFNNGGEQGSGLSVDSEIGWGFWGNYNFTNRLALGFEFNWTQPRYTATFIPEGNPSAPETISTRMDIFTAQAKGTFNFMEGAFTPYIEGSLGWTNVDSNVINGPPITGCWWDPWWGYICAPFFSTYSETVTSWGVAGGLRYDINPYYGLRLSYGIQELDTGSRNENPQLDMIRAEFTWRF